MYFDYQTRYRDGQRLFRQAADWWSYGLLFALLLAFPFFGSKFMLGELTYLMILAIASLGLMLLTGYTGQVSLGHAAFLAVGAYAHAWLLSRGVPWAVSVSMAAMLSAFVGVLLGMPAIRVSGLYLAMVTLAFSFIVTHIAGHWTSVTGGFTGMAVNAPSMFGVSLAKPAAFYFMCLSLLTLIAWAMINVTRSSLGRSLVAVRDSENAAYSLGVPVARVKVLAFAGSAGITGLAGALLAHHLQYLTPDAFTLLLSMELVLMVVIGGLGSVRGAILGAITIGLLPAFISRVKPFLPDSIAKQFGLETFVFGLVLALFVLFEPTGLNGRWLKLRLLLETFPVYRKDTFRRTKRYMKSERYR
jgi:branched-chain amino acid transport system permease protein